MRVMILPSLGDRLLFTAALVILSTRAYGKIVTGNLAAAVNRMDAKRPDNYQGRARLCVR